MANEITLKGDEYFAKIEKLTFLKSIDQRTYYLDEKTKERWLLEFLQPELPDGGPGQLRRISHFPWEIDSKKS